MSQLWEILQANNKTLGALLKEKMDGVDRRRSRTLKERLGFNGIGCCGGPNWGFRSTTTVQDNDDEEEEEEEVDNYVDQQHHQIHQQIQQPPIDQESINVPDPGCSSPDIADSGGNQSMNLAAALAAERELRAAEGSSTDEVGVGSTVNVPGTPFRVSLMRLLAETDGGDGADVGGGGGVKEGNDSVCCVCMVRKKGAAFIPCGHTYCRVCSREVWLNRGSCPLCNRSIVEILDIF